MAAALRRPGSHRFLKRREADLLVSDPVRAYKEQAQSPPLALAPFAMSSSSVTIAYCPTSLSRPILSVRDFCIQFEHHGDINVVDHVNLTRPSWSDHMGLSGASPVAVSPSPRWPSWG